MSTPRCFTDERSREMIADACQEAGLQIELLKELCELVERYEGSGRASGSFKEIQSILDRHLDTDQAVAVDTSSTTEAS